MSKVGILGTGQAALSLGLHLQTCGNDVEMYRDAKHPGVLANLPDQKIDVFGVHEGEHDIPQISNNIENFCESNQLVYLVAPTFAHSNILSNIKSHLTDEHCIVNVTANFSSLFYDEYFDRKHLNYLDINLSPFACRYRGDGALHNLGLKKKLFGATHKSVDFQSVYQKIMTSFPSELEQCNDSLHVALMNMNGICHPAILLFNAGVIGNGLSIYFNKDGVSHEVANFLEILDSERIAICDKMGYKTPTFLEVMSLFYDEKFETIYEFFRKSSVLNNTQLCPTQLNGRYIKEDIYCLLLGWYSLAKLAGVKSPAIKTILDISSIMFKMDFDRMSSEFENKLECFLSE